MRKILKILAYFLGGIIILAVAFIVYFNSTYPRVDPPSNEKVEITAARLERGKYLAHHVTVCMDCHSVRDWTKFSGPPKMETLGMGGDKFDEPTAGVPGILYAKNITPAGISNYTDGELMRVITNGVTKDNRALFPLMPYMGYNNLTKEDLFSIVAYIRSLSPIKNEVPESSLNFPVNMIVKTVPPSSYTPSPEPDRNKPAEFGKYLVTVAGCFDCHTQMVKGEFVMEKAFGGGFEFQLPGGTIRSANITPEPNSGIGRWTREEFIERFKSMDPEKYPPANVSVSEFNTIMPWTMYAGMKDEDLGAVYDYLRTIKPVKNSVVLFTPKK
ncbi:MAG: cytochrome C [Ignavibacteriae bacterium HGW-Ignavibacteriae-3]|nr:MAG: cytochrome C [Ignavibacteriae bacterium HGW-Ignavibacteriae-3]